MRDGSAISLKGVGKLYKLYPSRLQLALDALGLYRLRPGGAPPFPLRWALRAVDLEVGRGRRVGVIGRNGAGKTTLLRLVSGIAAPTEGDIRVEGRVQALLDTGLGFHPDFTGLENVKASLLFNGLDEAQTAQAVADVSAFAELGEYLHQPLKTYSQGMRARLGFATATAIHPDILIVDEVLAAGDAYFNAKSARRMQRLADSGCTLLLVSHSLQQVLQFCEQAIWIEEGSIVMQDHALAVVKAYEEFIDRLQRGAPEAPGAADATIADRAWFRREVLEEVMHGVEAHRRSGAPPDERVSRWQGLGGLRIEHAFVTDGAGQESRSFRSGEEMRLVIDLVAESAGDYPCRAGILLLAADGRALCRHLAPECRFDLQTGERRRLVMRYPELQLGHGEYVISVGLYRRFDPDDPNSAERYDLLSRSCLFRVRGKHTGDPTLFFHPAEWASPQTKG